MTLDLKKLSDDALHASTLKAARTEQSATLTTLAHLKEVYTRRLHSKLGYRSLNEYAIQALGFSEPAASQRIQALWLTMSIPEAEKKLESGELDLSKAAAIQRFFRQEEAVTEKKISQETKQAIVAEVSGLSFQKTKTLLLSHASDPERHLRKDTERRVTPTQTELGITVSQSAMDQIERVRELKGPLTLSQIFEAAIAAYAKQLDPMNQVLSKKRKNDTQETAAPQGQRLATQPEPSLITSDLFALPTSCQEFLILEESPFKRVA